MSKINVNQVDTQCGSTLTLGSSGKTVTLASGASQSGFGRTGTVDWCTTAKTSPFTATSGSGFFINTTSGAVTVTLPASPSAGDIVAFSDYASTFACNNLTICRNSSLINGGSFNTVIETSGIAATLVYVDGTRGWKQINDATENITGQPSFINASGGSITECGNFKIHTFTSDGTFTINSAPTPSNNNVSYMVIAGGAGGGSSSVTGGGGGAGGFREGETPAAPYTGSPLKNSSGLPVSIQAYPVTVGAGGTGAVRTSPSDNIAGGNGVNSTFSTITSAGGGGGGAVNDGGCASSKAQTGGSGGGAMGNSTAGTGAAGNTPPVSPPQGNNGGSAANPPSYQQTGGGGGATAVGQSKPSTYGPTGGAGGNGGAGATTSITGSPVAYAGGGGGGADTRLTPGAPAGTGGTGGGGNGVGASGCAGSGTANTGGGGGGGHGDGVPNGCKPGGNGGSGIVVIRYKFQ